MKLLVYSENEYGCGASIVAWILATEYAKMGHKVIYVFQNQHKSGVTEKNVQKIHLRISDISFKNKIACIYYLCFFILFGVLAKLPLSKNIKDFLIHRRRFYKFQKNQTICETLLKEIIEKQKPNALHIHSIPTNLTYEFINKISQKTPTVWTLHSGFLTKGYTTQYRNLQGELIESYPDFTFREVDIAIKDSLFKNNSNIHYVAPSAWLYHLVKPDFSFPENLHIVHNGLSPSSYFPKSKIKARQRLGLDIDKKYALAIIGKLHLEHKNFTILNDAFKQISDSNIELILIGNQGKWRKTFSENILFQGPIFDETIKSDYLCAADLFIIPSLADNFPTVILESLFCGTPILGANIGGIPEMVFPEKTGRLFSPYDAIELARKTEELINEDELLAIMSKNCITMSKAQFTLNYQAKQYLELLQQINLEDV